MFNQELHDSLIMEIQDTLEILEGKQVFPYTSEYESDTASFIDCISTGDFQGMDKFLLEIANKSFQPDKGLTKQELNLEIGKILGLLTALQKL